MALSLQNPLLVIQKILADTRKPKISLMAKALASYLSQHAGNPELQFVAISALSSNTVIADAPCKLRALYLKKPVGSTVASFLKFTDNATTGSATAPALSIELPTNQEEMLMFPDGLPFGSGIAALGNTTAIDTTASSAADRASGFAIISAP